MPKSAKKCAGWAILRAKCSENRLGRLGMKNALVNVLRRIEGMVETRKRGMAARIAILTGLMAVAGDAQSLMDQVNFKSVAVGGFHLYGVSAFTGYSTSVFPLGLGQTAPTGTQDLGPSINYGVSASFGWQLHREKTNLSMIYSGTYTGVARYSDLNAFSHSLSVTASRQITTKWTFTLAGAAQDSTLAEYMYQPSALSVKREVIGGFR